MKLSLSCRIAEGFLSKDEASMSLDQLCRLARDAGYKAICMRPSQLTIDSPEQEIVAAAETIRQFGLSVSMISGHADIVYNNERGPDCLRNITPHLDLADAWKAPLIRVCIKTREDLVAAQRAADEAAERGMTLVHQCHVQSQFETIDQIIGSLETIARPNFGLIYEAANLEECRQDYGPDTVARLGRWIRNVYLQNQRIDDNGAVTVDTWTQEPVSFDIIDIFEAGGIDFPLLLQGLQQAGYDGVITVHQSSPTDGASAAESARRTADYLRTLM